jgi:amino acid adenylation domain-containing protein
MSSSEAYRVGNAASAWSDTMAPLPVQQAMWLEQQFAGHVERYVTGDLVWIDAPLDPDRFATALSRAVAEADGLRLRVTVEQGQMLLRVAPAGPVALERVDLSAEPNPAMAATAWMQTALAVPIPLDAPCLYRFALLRLGPAAWAWARVFNHIAADARGRAALTARTAALLSPSPGPAPAPFAEALAAASRYRDSQRYADGLAYWRARLANLPPLLFPASAPPRPSARVGFEVAPAVVADLRATASRLAVSLPRLLLALSGRCLLSTLRREAVTIGVQMDLRPGARFRDTVGCFATPLPVPFAAQAEESLDTIVQRLDQALRRDVRHRMAPTHLLARDVRAGGAPLFDVMFNFLPAPAPCVVGGVAWRTSNASHGSANRLLLTIAELDAGQRLEIRLDHDPGVLSEAEAHRLATALEQTLCASLQTQQALPLLPPQMEIFTAATLFPMSSAYTISTALWLDGPLDPARYARAWNAAIADSEAWRLRLVLNAQGVFQIVMPPSQHDVPVVDLSGEPDPEAAARQALRAAPRRVILPTDPTLVRMQLYRLAANRHMGVLTYHHVIADGAVRHSLFQRLCATYAGTASPPRHGRLIADVARDFTAYRQSSAFAEDAAHWQARLAELPAPLVAAGPYDGVFGGVGREARERFTLADFQGIEAVAARLGVAPFRVLLTLIGIALARAHDRDALTISVHVHNRDAPDLADSDAHLAGQIPFRFESAPGTPLGEAIRATSAAYSRDRAHRRFPSDALRTLSSGGGRLADVSFNYLRGSARYDLGEVSGFAESESAGFFLPWKFDVRDAADPNGLLVTINYDAELVAPALARGVAEALQLLLRSAGDALATPAADLPILPPADEATLLARARGPVRDLPGQATLPALIAAQALRRPGAIAVQDAAEAIDYRTLQTRAEALAATLAGAGVGAGAVVAVALPRGVALVVALLAVQQAGATFLPVDPTYPAARVAWMLADSACALVLTVAAMAANLPPEVAQLRLDAALPPARGEPPAPDPAAIAYILYTSGSTGQPKAVRVAQRSIANLALWGAELLGEDLLDGMLFATALVFDVAMFELFSPLVAGGRLVVAENLLSLPDARLLDQVRVVSGSPTVLAALLRSGRLPKDMRCVVSAGEALSRDLAERLLAARPGLRLVNAYGPTEATVYASTADIRPGEPDAPPIGQAINNMALYVLDRAGRLLPDGAVGELCLAGVGVAEGYLNRPELTEARFVPNPFGPGRLYRTGDRVHWRADGHMAFLGRADTQLKLHGVRIEAGEVEAALEARPDVGAAVVGVHQSDETTRLVAWVVPAKSALDPAALREYLLRNLPSVMVPASFVMLPRLPLTVSGKLDRAALPPPPRTPASPCARRAPVTAMQRAVFDLWCDVVELDDVRTAAFGIDDDLFDLGGDSLAAVLLFSAFEAKFGVAIPPGTFVHGITVARLADLLAAPHHDAGPGRVLELQPHGAGRPLFFIQGIGGNPINLYALARTFGATRPFLALKGGWNDAEAGPQSIEALAARYVGVLRARQPHGPYLLGGYSFGATVAFEMAQQLHRAGTSVGLLALIDASPTGYRVGWRRAPMAAARWLANLPGWVREDLLVSGWAVAVANVKRHLRVLGRRAWGDRGPDIARVLDTRRLTADEFETHLRHFLAAEAYQPRPYPGEITVLSARTQPLMRFTSEDSLGWHALAHGGVVVRRVPGNHLSLMRSLSVALNALLDTADPPAAAAPATVR